jgi:hypothetical protein
MDSDDAWFAELLTLPGTPLVLRRTGDHQLRSAGAEQLDSTTVGAWLGLVTAMLARMSEELRLGEPQLLTLSVGDQVIAVAIDASGGFMAVIAGEPSCLGLAISKLRSWLRTYD